MAKERNPSDISPFLPKVESVTLDGKNKKLKIIGICALAVIALAAFAYAAVGLLNGGGWTDIDVQSGERFNCSEEISLKYNLSGMQTADRKKLSLLYTEASEDVYAIFNPSQHVDGVTNLYDVSASAGKEVTVEPALYEAFEMFEKYGNRSLYLAPIYQVYDDMFFCEDDSAAQQFDPEQNEDISAYFTEVLSFVNSKEHVNLVLLGNNTVRLDVSEDYLSFAKENQIDYFLDFYWAKNAFGVDYIAYVLNEAGFTKGLVSSIDGYVRCLDNSGEEFSMNLFSQANNAVVTADTLKYSCPLTMVTFTGYPISADSVYSHYYKWSDGRITSGFIDAETGISKTSLPELYAVSESLGCGETALAVFPYFVSDSFDENGVKELNEKNIITMWWGTDSLKKSSEDTPFKN